MPLDNKTRTRFKRVCGLTGRQKVNINLPSFDSLKKEGKERLFDINIQPYVEFPADLRKKAIKLSMKIISSARRNHKYRLGQLWRDGKDPFQIYKELNQEDWNTFWDKLRSDEAQSRREQMSQLRGRHGDHHLGSDGYIGKKRQ